MDRTFVELEELYFIFFAQIYADGFSCPGKARDLGKSP